MTKAQLEAEAGRSSYDRSQSPPVENDFAWYSGMTAFDFEWEPGTDSAIGLSTSDQNGSADDSPRNQTQGTPANRFGYGFG